MGGSAPWYWNKVNLFDEASAEARQAFFLRAERHEYRRGQHVFRANDPATRVFYLESGMVKIYHLSPQGALTIFWFCVPGDLFGAGGITGSFEQSVYGQAEERSTVFTIPRQAFEEVLKAHPQLAINVIRLMGARLRLACDAMTDKVSLKTDVRLARLLLRLAQNWGHPGPSGIELQVKITHQELSNMIGACRQTVNRTLREFQRLGWIHIADRLITMTRPEQLERMIENSYRHRP